MRGDKECPFSGVTKSGRVWRKVPESDARIVGMEWIWGGGQGSFPFSFFQASAVSPNLLGSRSPPEHIWKQFGIKKQLSNIFQEFADGVCFFTHG